MWDDEKTENSNGNVFKGNEYSTSTELDKDFNNIMRSANETKREK